MTDIPTPDLDAPGSHTFTARLTVRSYEVDGYMHVNNAVFVQYLEAARGQFLLAIGLGYAKFQEWDAFPVVTELEVTYEASALVDDDLLVTMRYTPVKRTQFEMTYLVRNARTEQILVRARTRHAFRTRDGRTVRVPDEFADAFARI